jgi:hypothetical protein
MKMSVSTKTSRNVVSKATSILAALLLVLIPASGFGGFSPVVSAIAEDGDVVFSNDTSLSTFTVDGQNATDGSTFNIARGRTSVEVVAVTTDELATASTAGNTNLRSGSNLVTVTVEADDGTVQVYSVTVVVAAPSSVNTISSISLNGADFTTSFLAGTPYQAPIGTTQVTVSVVPTSNLASVLVTGNTGLSAGDNFVNVKVTAEDGSIANYPIKVVVATPNANTGLSLFNVNGTSLLSALSLDLPFGTSAVTVQATTQAGTSTLTVTGQSGLRTGANVLSVRVVAESGAVQVYERTLNVLAPSSDKAITGITVNGISVVNSAVTLGRGTSSATVVVTLSSPFAIYSVSGADSLNPGSNSVSITVTAQDGSTQTSAIAVTVYEASTVNTLSGITVDGQSVAINGTVNKDFGTTSVSVVATPTSNLSAAVVSGTTDLDTGINTITIQVTAESGAVANYVVFVDVAKSADNSLSSISVNGSPVSANGTVNLSPGTTSVNVVAIATSPEATVVVSGRTGLSAGANIVTITVTAANGTAANYTFTANVLALSTETALAVLTINGQDALTAQTIYVDTEVDEAFVIAQTLNSNATYAVTSSTALPTPGTYTITVVVTAENTNFTRAYNVTVVRAAAISDNANLGSIKIGNVDVAVGSNFAVPAGTTQVDVVALAQDPSATVSVTGENNLKTGTNEVTVLVTAASSRTVAYKFNVVVALSNNTDLTAITVNGSSLSLSNLNFQVSPTTTSVVVSATPADVDAIFAVTGQGSLVVGENNVVITVTAADGVTTRDYTIKVVRESLSANVALASITLDGEPVVAGSTVDKPNGTSAVSVTATAADPDALVSITGTSSLITGTNIVSILVTAPSGASRTYTVSVRVLALSSDTSLALFTINGEPFTENMTVDLDGTRNFVQVVAQATDSNAIVEVSGSTNLVIGANPVTVKVTAEDGTFRTYSLTVFLPDRTSTALSTFTIDGNNVVDEQVIQIAAGVTEVEVVAVPAAPNATVEIEGGTDLEPGENTVTVTVTALDGETVGTYTVTLIVRTPPDTSLESLTIGGEDALGGSVTLPAGTRAARVVAVTTDPFASFVVEGNAELSPGENSVIITVTAADGETTEDFEVIVTVEETLLGQDASLESLTIAGQDALGGSVTLGAGTRAASVVAVTTDPFASYVVEGNQELGPGENTVVITVTAADGETTETYEVAVFVAGTSGGQDTSLESLTIGGEDALGGSVTLPAGTRAARVEVLTTDPFASYVVEGNAELVGGENIVLITVTAADGETTEDFEVVVTVEEFILSDDATVETFLINGIDATSNDVIELPFGITRVNVRVITTDPTASYSVTGDGRDEPLVEGENELVLTVTAANGDSETYTVILILMSMSTNNSLDPEEGLFVNDQQVDLELLDTETGFVNLPLTAERVSIRVKAESPTADVTVNGKTALPASARFFGVEKGVNEFDIEVIPEAGLEELRTYKLKVYVGGADATLKLVKVNSTTITLSNDGIGRLETPLSNDTTSATLFVEPTVAQAVGLGNGTTIEFDGGEATVTKSTIANTWNISGLVSGENTIGVIVTPGDPNAEEANYSIVIPVALSSDKRLKLFKVNGAPVKVGSVFALPKGTDFVEIDGETQSELAMLEVSGGDELVPGKNILEITVTAEDESTQTYKVTAIVPKVVTTIVISFPKVGVVTVDKKSNVKGNAALTAALKKIKGTVGLVKITNNFLIVKDKPTAGPARANNVKKYLTALKTNSFKTATYQLVADPKAKKSKGTTVTIYSY